MTDDLDNRNDEMRDAELDALREAWEAPAPAPGFHQRVLTAYQSEFRRTGALRRWFSMPIRLAFGGIAAVALVVLGVTIGTHVHKQPPGSASGSGNGSGPAAVAPYQPVHQPRFIVISQGENP